MIVALQNFVVSDKPQHNDCLFGKRDERFGFYAWSTGSNYIMKS